MLKILSILRRILLAGVCSLIIIIILFVSGFKGLSFVNADVIGSIYLCFALASPIIGLFVWIISTLYIRKWGQSAAYQQTLSFRSTMIGMLTSDILSPFKLIKEQFSTKKQLVDYYSQITQLEIADMLAEGSKAINRLKLVRMFIRFFIYGIGIVTSVYVLNSIPG